MIELAVVIPCYNEQEVLRETCYLVTNLLRRLQRAGKVSGASRVYLVDDGSRDGTWAIIESLSCDGWPVVGVRLSCNRGHQNALLAGLLTARGDAIVSVDADLQDDIDVIEQMVDHHSAGADIVYGVRNSRATDTWFKRFTARAFYRLLAALGARTIPHHADYRLMSRRAIEALRQYREVNLFLRGLVPSMGFRSSIVYYARSPRFAGVSKYPLCRMCALALDGITSFSVVPLRIISVTGLAVFIFTVFMSLWIVWVKLFTDQAVPGWASVLLPVCFLGGIQLLCLGVLGEYVGKLYGEAKARPRYLIEKISPQSDSVSRVEQSGALAPIEELVTKSVASAR